MEASSASLSVRYSRSERDQKFGPCPRWIRKAACTFSSTVSLGKMLVRWNERPRPMPQILKGATPVMSRPSTTTRPAVGCRWPVMRLNSVDLPAPFGPITAAISPSATARSTSLTARKPPNDLDRPLTSSTLHLDAGRLGSADLGTADTLSLAPQPGKAGRQAADDAAGEDEQQDEQDRAENERPVLGVGRRLLVQEHQGARADDRAP